MPFRCNAFFCFRRPHTAFSNFPSSKWSFTCSATLLLLICEPSSAWQCTRSASYADLSFLPPSFPFASYDTWLLQCAPVSEDQQLSFTIAPPLLDRPPDVATSGLILVLNARISIAVGPVTHTHLLKSSCHRFWLHAHTYPHLSLSPML